MSEKAKKQSLGIPAVFQRIYFPEPTPDGVPSRIAIDFFKLSTAPVCLFLLIAFKQYALLPRVFVKVKKGIETILLSSTLLFTALMEYCNSTYYLISRWYVKSRIFPDKRFEQKLPLWYFLLTMYGLGGYFTVLNKQ